MDSRTPRFPDRYADARLVARGGMGEVWRARDTQLDRDVAFKLLVTGAGAEPEATRRARFLREARAVAQLSSHPNVVTIYDQGELDGAPWLAMEWLSGGTLAERMAQGAVEHDDALRWLEQVAAGLDAAHRAGIVHRDVKPGNVLFDAEGTARIADFGIATWTREGTAALTQPGSVIGTVTYLSPEQARGEAVGPAGDQYSLLAIAFELLLGRRPYERASTVAELAAHASDPPPVPSEHAQWPSSAVDAVFARALAKQPADRYGSCSEAIRALEEALARPNGSPRVVEAPMRTHAAVSRGRVALTAVLMMLLVGGVLVAVADGPGDEPAAIDRAPATTTPAAPTDAERQAAAIERHERGFELLQQERYAEALELSLSALRELGGVEPWEAYASYNVGASLIGVGRCAEALGYLDRSEQLQGRREEIDVARARARDCIEASEDGDGDDRPGKGKGRDKDDDD